MLNAIRWQLADGSRPPEPEHVQKERVFCGRPVPVVTKAMFRTTGFTAAHMRGAEFHGWQTTSVLVEHVRSLVADGAPFVYAYYSGVDEVAHAYGLETQYYPAELAAADRLVGALLDALPDDVALVVTADHGQVQVGHDGWRSLKAAAPDGRDLRGRRPVPSPPRQAGPARPSSTPRPRSCTAPTPGSSVASSCSTRAGSGPIRCPRSTGGSATSCSPPARPSGSSTRRCRTRRS